MIVKKQWVKRDILGRVKYVYTGHFLFSVLPIYINREGY